MFWLENSDAVLHVWEFQPMKPSKINGQNEFLTLVYIVHSKPKYSFFPYSKPSLSNPDKQVSVVCR